jgi:hypothetical protein
MNGRGKLYLIHGIFSDGTKDNPNSDTLNNILQDGLKSKNALGTGNKNHDDHNYVFFSIYDAKHQPNHNAILIEADGSEHVWDHDKPKTSNSSDRFVSQLKDFDVNAKFSNLTKVKCNGMPEIAFYGRVDVSKFHSFIKLEIAQTEINDKDIDIALNSIKKYDETAKIYSTKGSDGKFYIRCHYNYQNYMKNKDEICNIWENHQKIKNEKQPSKTKNLELAIQNAFGENISFPDNEIGKAQNQYMNTYKKSLYVDTSVVNCGCGIANNDYKIIINENNTATISRNNDRFFGGFWQSQIDDINKKLNKNGYEMVKSVNKDEYTIIQKERMIER